MHLLKRLFVVLLSLTLIAVVAALAFPSVSGPMGRRQIASINNAKNVYAACVSYAGDHEGRFPQALSELCPTYLKDPLTKNRAETDFDYFGGTTTDAPDKVLLRSKPAAKGQYQVVIHRDGAAVTTNR